MKRYNSTYEVFILIVSILSFITIFLILATRVVQYVHILSILLVADTVFCVIFGYDFFRSLVKADHRWSYLKWGWMDLLGSIPFLLTLRIFRLRRVIDATNHLRGMEPEEISNKFRDNPARSTLFITFVITIVVVFTASTMIVRLEQHAASPWIKDGEDAIWWTLVTMTTVGYGDFVPVTSGGRIVAVVLMFLGIGLFGVLTSYVASSFAAPIHERREANITAIQNDLEEIKGMLNDMRSNRQ
jgi:voltage-gated potassium channel